MKMRKQDILQSIKELESFQGTLKSKYMRNLRLYLYSPTLSLTNIDDSEVVGYYNRGSFSGDDGTSSVQENVIKSVIDTLVSKIASQKVRPFFNTKNGTSKDTRIVKQAQQFFDILFSEKDVNSTVAMAFRDACVFDRGIIYCSDNDIRRVLPWQVYFDPRECTYGEPTRAVYKREHYPARLLPVSCNLKECTYYDYYDTIEHIHTKYIPELNRMETVEWTPSTLPFITVYYDNPVKATSSESVVDLLYGIQMQVDYLNKQIRNASRRASPLKYIVPEQSNVRVQQLTNRAGEVITYKPIPNQTTVPVVAMTEPMMDSQWLELLKQYIQDAYDMVGISQLSAQSRKPQGLNSGVALSTMEDIESDRFETQLNTVIHTYVNIAKKLLDIVPPEAELLPSDKWRNNISWGDFVAARNRMAIQFSAAEFLSDDPSVKIQQIQQLVMGGYISRARASMLLEIPDLQTGYSLSNNAINAVLQVIDDCLDNNVYDIPDFIPTKILMEEITNAQLSLWNGRADNASDIAKLDKLYMIAAQKERDSMASAELSAASQLNQELQEQMTAALQPGGALAQAQQKANITEGVAAI